MEAKLAGSLGALVAVAVIWAITLVLGAFAVDSRRLSLGELNGFMSLQTVLAVGASVIAVAEAP